ESPAPPRAIHENKSADDRRQPFATKPDKQPRNAPINCRRAPEPLDARIAPNVLFEEPLVDKSVTGARAENRQGKPSQAAAHRFLRNTMSRCVKTSGHRTFSNSMRPVWPTAAATSDRSRGRSSGNFHAPTDSVTQRATRYNSVGVGKEMIAHPPGLRSE